MSPVTTSTLTVTWTDGSISTYTNVTGYTEHCDADGRLIKITFTGRRSGETADGAVTIYPPMRDHKVTTP